MCSPDAVAVTGLRQLPRVQPRRCRGTPVMAADLLLMGGVHTQHALERKRVLFRHRKDGVQGINILRLDHINGLKAGWDRSGS